MERVTKELLRTMVRQDRARFDAVLTRVRPERLAEPMLPGGWSVKDVLWHIAWGDREAIGVMRQRALVGSPLWELGQDERNEAVVREGRGQELDTVLAEYRDSYVDFLTELDRMSDDDLNDPARIDGLAERIPGWRPWRVIYDPEHYADHAQVIEDALRDLG